MTPPLDSESRRAWTESTATSESAAWCATSPSAGGWTSTPPASTSESPSRGTAAADVTRGDST